MWTQTLALTLQAVIAAGMLFQIVALARCTIKIVRKGRSSQTSSRSAVVSSRAATIHQAPVRRHRRRDYRIALRTARVTLAA
ncbi:unnamed protein product [Gemmata obscuriglobus UQM 2246]|nr:unnamed protein product [Gemmata obscuriglobus UQM 2246]